MSVATLEASSQLRNLQTAGADPGVVWPNPPKMKQSKYFDHTFSCEVRT